jgi:hypothetical protein
VSSSFLHPEKLITRDPDSCADNDKFQLQKSTNDCINREAKVNGNILLIDACSEISEIRFPQALEMQRYLCLLTALCIQIGRRGAGDSASSSNPCCSSYKPRPSKRLNYTYIQFYLE